MTRYFNLIFAAVFVISVTGCSSIKEKIPSFWDDNQARSAIDIRQSIVQLDCKQNHAIQLKKIHDQVEWLNLYSESKRTHDIIRLTQPMTATIDEFYQRSISKPGSITYCEIKKSIMVEQSNTVANAIHRRF